MYLCSFLPLWSSLKELFLISCQAIHISLFLWDQLLEVYCVPLGMVCFLDFCNVFIFTYLYISPHIWRSIHLYHTLWTDFSKEGPSPVNGGTIESAVTPGSDVECHIHKCMLAPRPRQMWCLIDSGWWDPQYQQIHGPHEISGGSAVATCVAGILSVFSRSSCYRP